MKWFSATCFSLAVVLGLWLWQPPAPTNVQVNARLTGAGCPEWVNYAGPFPDASCTGVPAGTELTAYSGPYTFESGTVTIDKKTITQPLCINGGSVTITNSSISVNDGCYTDGDGEAIATHGGTLSISDSTINCGGDPPGGYNNSHGLGNSNVTALRVDIIGCENGLSIGGHDNDLRDSYIHDLRQCTNAEGCGPPDGSHSDGIQTGPGATRTTVIHNTILSMKAGAHTPEPDASYYTTSAVITDPNDSYGTYNQNLFAGGSYTFYCPENASSDWSLNNNTFDRRYISTVGFSGPTDACAGHGTGNKYEDGSTLTLSWLAPFRWPVWALGKVR